MKTIKYFLLFAILILQTSCEEEGFALFDGPMPKRKPPLKYFPRKLQGNYESNDEKAILTITDRMMYTTYDYDFIEPKDTTDKTFVYQADTVYVKEHDKRLTNVRYSGDSVTGHFHVVDTLFVISETNVLKKFRGYYFLNQKNGDRWNVEKMWLQKGQLKTGDIADTTDIALLNTITERGDDTSATPYHVTHKQFVKMVNESFSSVTSYTRLPGKL